MPESQKTLQLQWCNTKISTKYLEYFNSVVLNYKKLQFLMFSSIFSFKTVRSFFLVK